MVPKKLYTKQKQSSQEIFTEGEGREGGVYN